MSRLPVVASFAVASLLALPAVAQAQGKPSTVWVPASSSNYGGGRTATDLIVIHKAEGSLDACTSWFQNSSARVSAHYCVDDNEIAQCVQDQYVAWHAGNSNVNHRSIGIENSGYTNRNDFTDAHYRRLGQLVAYICRQYGIPADRQHIIGHNEVPDPTRPGHYGGAGGHTDPGPYFNWSLLMQYVQADLNGGGIAAVPAPATTTTSTMPASLPAASTSGNAQAVVVTGNVTSLNVRDAAWGSIIGQAPGGSAWVLTGAQDQGFYQIWYRGGSGWVSGNYVSGYTGPGVQIAATVLNVRDAASASNSTIVGAVHQGDQYVSGQVSNDGFWIVIRFDENRRWVYKPYTTGISLAP
jgi:hypothetical protein